MKKLKSISLMFPVYKDSRTVKKMIRDSLVILKRVSKKFEIIIVDDGCPENSGNLAQKLIKKKYNVNVVFHKKNLGYGAALKTGLNICKYEWIFQVDGDAEYSVFDLKKLLNFVKTSDLIITYRKKKKYTTLRIFISWVYNNLLRKLFNTQFKDISTGSRLIKKKILNKIKINSNSPFVGAELAIKSKYYGFKVNEVGVQTYPRVFGNGSSVGIKNIILTIIDMIKLFIKLNKNEKYKTS